MPINQFAKISPLVDSTGKLLAVNQDGILLENSSEETRYLKNNELGIDKENKQIITMYDGKVIKLKSIDKIYTKDELREFVSLNRDGEYDGKLVCVERTASTDYISVDTYDICVIDGLSYRNISDGLVYGAYFKITDDTVKQYTTDSHIKLKTFSLPYKVTRATIKINKDLTNSNSEKFNGSISLSSRYIDYDADYVWEQPLMTTRFNKDIDESHIPVSETYMIFDNCFGDLLLFISDDDTGTNVSKTCTNLDIEVYIEYIIN